MEVAENLSTTKCSCSSSRFWEMISTVRYEIAMIFARCIVTVRTATLVVGWLSLVVLILVTFVINVGLLLEKEDDKTLKCLETKDGKLTNQIKRVIFNEFMAMFMGISACLLYGTYKRRAGFLLPYLVTYIIGEVAGATLLVYLITIGARSSLIQVLTLSMVLEIFCLCFVRSHYDELRSNWDYPIKSEAYRRRTL